MHFILVRETWSHMSVNSGFDPLFKRFQQTNQINCDSYFVREYQFKSSIFSRLINKLFRFFFGNSEPLSLINEDRSFSPFVQSKHEQTAKLVVQELKKSPEALVLLSVCENQYANEFGRLPDSLKGKIVLFVHQPPAWFKLFWKDLLEFKKFAGIICLCESQSAFFSTLTDKKVFQIRHGVELDFFRPDFRKKQDQINHILFVGNWLRDIEILEKSFIKLNKIIQNLELNCVVPLKDRNHPSFYNLAKFENVKWHSDISSEELRDLYNNSSLLFLPLIDSTANNAINEAISCGLPVVTTDVGGTKDYLDESFARLCKYGDVEDHVKGVLELINLKTSNSEIINIIRSMPRIN